MVNGLEVAVALNKMAVSAEQDCSGNHDAFLKGRNKAYKDTTFYVNAGVHLNKVKSAIQEVIEEAPLIVELDAKGYIAGMKEILAFLEFCNV